VKLLFDQNISFRVVSKLKSTFPNCAQVRALHLEDKSDKEIWDFAKKHEYTIVTFDADFFDLGTLYGHPPKIVWLRIGNTNTNNLINVLNNHANSISDFINSESYAQIACLEIY
jgi:predicted nuclease of predicted toxin-antitoxin system